MKKKIIYLSIILVLVISLITLSSIYKSKDNKYKKEYNTISKGMAIMIKEEGATDYVQSNSKDIPKGNYVLNEEKTHCENNGKVTNYNSSSGTISINFIGSDKCYLYFDYKTVYVYETILLNNSNGANTLEGAKSYIKGKGTPDFTSIATTNEGIYAAEDDLGTSYYFRGAVDNNWVKFGKNGFDKDIYWRIIRINGDNSIRMIYTGTTAPTSSTSVVMTGTDTQINTSAFSGETSTYSEYVGYMYTDSVQHGLTKNSLIKSHIDDWFKNSSLFTDASTKALLADGIFCNDRNVTSGSWARSGNFSYDGYRVYSNSKDSILKCSNKLDRFTVDSSNGNGALTYPVGTITGDEMVYAGMTSNSSNLNSYLYTNEEYWTITPGSMSGLQGFQIFNVFVRPTGQLYFTNIQNYSSGIRPVINLSSSVKLSGDGTYNNVYTVS